MAYNKKSRKQGLQKIFFSYFRDIYFSPTSPSVEARVWGKSVTFLTCIVTTNIIIRKMIYVFKCFSPHFLLSSSHVRGWSFKTSSALLSFRSPELHFPFQGLRFLKYDSWTHKLFKLIKHYESISKSSHIWLQFYYYIVESSVKLLHNCLICRVVSNT